MFKKFKKKWDSLTSGTRFFIVVVSIGLIVNGIIVLYLYSVMKF